MAAQERPETLIREINDLIDSKLTGMEIVPFDDDGGAWWRKSMALVSTVYALDLIEDVLAGEEVSYDLENLKEWTPESLLTFRSGLDKFGDNWRSIEVDLQRPVEGYVLTLLFSSQENRNPWHIIRESVTHDESTTISTTVISKESSFRELSAVKAFIPFAGPAVPEN